MLHRLLSPDSDTALEDLAHLIISSSCTSAWRALLQIDKRPRGKRELQFATLLNVSAKEDDEEKRGVRSLLLAPTRPVREWAARCFNLLLKAEALPALGGNGGGLSLRSEVFREGKNLSAKVSPHIWLMNALFCQLMAASFDLFLCM